ncbi:MAG TPA: FMN-binding negative transcriptional regulator [Rhizomicrobium sp.]|nr:FMN-binding negative transcriptional regulator [Rhizomicrobium sp.]
MYTPAYSREDRTDVMQDAMRRIGFATLVTTGEGGIQASHLPMVLDAGAGPLGTLSGHFARPNPQARTPREALAIFLGPHAYVSPSWIPAKRETGKAVPTWNYIAVHAAGPLTLHDDAGWLRDHLEKLTAANEAHRPDPWKVSDAPGDYIAAMQKGIIGFSMAVARLEGKWKLSQNHPETTQAEIAAGLRADGHAALADLMQI